MSEGQAVMLPMPDGATFLNGLEDIYRKGVNPKTLQQIRIPKSKTVKFVPGKDFKSKV